MNFALGAQTGIIMAAKTTKKVLAHVADTLATAKLGLQDVLSGGPDRRLGGLRNLIVFGRAVTNVLQNLRSTEPAFEAWYAAPERSV